MKSFFTVFLFPALFVISACSPEPKKSGIDHVQWLAMGTGAAVSVPEGAAPPVSEVRTIVQKAFNEIENDLSRFKPDAPLARLNAAAGSEETFPFTGHLKTTVEAALNLWGSSGVFNPCIGPFMKEAWGFYAERPPETTPAHELLEKLAPLTTPETVIELGEGTIRLTREGASLDLGGIAKGYAVDIAFQQVAAAGIENALIDLGGNLRALGKPRQDSDGWITGVRNPFNTAQLLGTFILKPGFAVATSGNYERFVTIQGRRYAHIIDPRTGVPVTGMAGVTVVAPSATLADGLSTTLFILGPEEGYAFLKKQNYPDVEAIWIPETGSRIISTPGFPELTLSNTRFTQEKLK